MKNLLILTFVSISITAIFFLKRSPSITHFGDNLIAEEKVGRDGEFVVEFRSLKSAEREETMIKISNLYMTKKCPVRFSQSLDQFEPRVSHGLRA